MKKFIYVFSEADRDKLIDNGLNLIKIDKENNIFIFENSEDIVLSNQSFSFILSDAITF